MKNFNFFDKLFGTVGSPNQTDETQTRENRIGLMSYLRRTLMLLFAVLVMSIANIGTAWGADATFTMSAIFTGSNTSASVSSPVNATVSTTTSASNADDGKLSNDDNYFQVLLSDDTFTDVSFNGYINTDKTSKNWAFQFTTNGGTTWGSEVTQANDGTKSAHDIEVGVSIPSGANGIRIIRKAGTSTYVFSITFALAGGVTKPTFSPATGSSLVKSTGTVTLTSSGNTVYYKWSQTDNQYASGAGATLAGAADNSGTSPVNTTAPSTAGTWYLYAVAYDGDAYSNVVKATYTITNPTHTLTWNLDGGTATGGTAAGAVAEGATLTAPTVTKVGYDFAGWSSTVPATMPAADATYTATWTKVYVPAGASYNFVNQGDGSVTWGSSHTVTLPAGTKTTVPAGSRVDNIFFSTALDIEYEKGAEAGTGFKGWKIKQSGKLAFYVENDCDVIVTNGIINGMKIHYYNQSNVETNTNLTSTEGTREETAHVKGGTLFEIVSTTTSTNTLKGIMVSSSCTAPTSSSISGTTTYTAGETISLTASASGTDASTTYQWYKGDPDNGGVSQGDASTSGATFSKASCVVADGATYYCVISNGEGCTVTTSQVVTVKPSVSVGPTVEDGNYGYRYTTGETIKLTATAGGASSYTYKWQKYVNSAWSDLANGLDATDGGTFSGVTTANLQISGCTTANVGSYRCVVTGGGQTNESTGYRVRVYTLHGYYFGDSEHAVDYPIVWTSETSGVATVSLNESSTYTFKITDNDGKWYGSGAGNYIIQPVSMNCGTSNTNVELRLLTGPAGSYTFTVDITNAQLGNGSDYVSVTTAYPSVTHPADGYIYLKKDWDHCYLYAWYDGSNKLTAWGDAEPEVTTYTSICDYNYFYMPALSYYTNFILHDKRGDGASNSTGNQSFTSNTGKLITHNGVSWVWQNIKKTISFNANGGTGTTASVKVCPGADVAAPANGFTRTGWEFDGWCTNKYGKGKKIYKPEDEISDVAADSTFYAMWKKTVYFKVGAEWDGSSAWYAIYCFDSENDNDPYRDWVRMNTAASSCETDVFKGDLPGNGYDKLIVCRMDGSKDALAWDSKWNQTGNISYDELDDNDQFTPTSLSGDECTGSWGTYSAPTYTISFAANGSDGGTDMTDVEDIECEGEVTLDPNTWTKTGYSFAGWKTNVAITANSSSVAANGIVTDEATISDITSDITLTAQWSQIMVTGITLDPSSKTLDVGDTQTITATVSPSNALDKTIDWSSSNRDVATVSSSGIVTAVAPGSATITATAHDGSGITQTCSITVNKLQPTKFDFSVDKTVLCDEETATLTLENSEDGVTYGLRSDATHSIADTETDGTGEAIEWTGLGTGSYVVYAIENATYSERQMNGSKITISAGTATSITTQPTDVTDATAGEETSLTVEAEGSSLSYQWKESSSQDGTYSNVASGGTSATYDVTPAAAGTTWYKCVVTGTCGTETTDAVKIVAAAAADPIITYTMDLTNGNDWGTSDTDTEDETNITSLSANNTHASQTKTANGSKSAGCTTAQSGTSRDENIYVEFCFTVASGKTLIPSKVFLEVSNIGSSSDGNMTYDAILSDGTRSVSGSVTPASDGTLTELQFTNADDSKCMIGNVTLRVYPYNNNGGKTGEGFRMGQYVKIWGEIEDIPEYTLSWNFNGGGCSETAGDDYTAGGDVTYGTAIEFPSNLSMSKPGYKFTGWSDGTSTYNEGDDYMMPNEDVEFTAQWESFTMPNVSGLDVDAGATLSSIPLSWSIPGICDLSKVMEPFTPNGGDGVGSKDSYTYNYNAGEDYDDVYAVGDAPKWGQYGIGFPLPSPTSGFEWLSYEYKGKRADMSFWLGIYNKDNTGEVYNDHDNNQALDDDENWQESGKLYPDKYYWGKTISGSLTDKSITHIAIYVNSGDNGANNDVPVSVRNIRYHLSGQNDIDHVVLMRKEGSAATGIADPSATKLYEGTKSHYTDASDVTGKNYYYTVFAVHANGAVSTGVSTSLTLYTITYNAGANGTGTVPAGKKTHGIDFTLSSSTFTRGGFTQDGWSTSDGGAKVYELGGTYSGDEAIILYPHWVADAAEDITNGNPSNGTISITDGVSSLSKASAGATVTITATPATGYNFTSWDVYKTGDASTKVSTAESTASTSFIMPAYAVTVDASFTAKTYTVTLNGNGGSGNTANVTATYNSSTLSSSITNPTLTGYIFDGWYSGEGGTGSLVISKTGALQASVDGYTGAGGIWTKDATATLYAKWITILPATLNKSNMTAVSGNMTYYSTNYFDYGDGSSGTNLDRWVEWDVYLIPCKYTVSTTGYYSTGHQWRISIKNTEEAYELPSTYEATATETGASSWDLTGLSEGVYTVRVMNIMEWGQPKLLSLTLSATVYTVTYDANGGTCGTASVTVCGGDEVTLPSALGDGAFEGWYTSSDEEIGGTGDSYKPTADITLYAHWGASCSDPEEPTAFAATEVKMNRATFSITDDEDAASYDLYYASGSPSTPTSGTTETENVTTKTPTITGLSSETTYKIWVRSVCDATHKSDWVALGAEGGAFTTPAPETYTITYNTDGAAEDQISDGEKTEGTNFTLSSTRYTKAGYWQVGWATSQGGSKIYNFGGTYSTDADLTLYPAWEKIAVYDPDMSTETKLTTTIGAKFGEVDRWTLSTGGNLVGTPKDVSSDAEDNLTGEKYGLAYTPSWSSVARYDLGAQTTLYQLTLDIVMGGNGSLTAELLNGSSGVVKTITNDIPINKFTAWEKKTFTYTYDAGLANVRYIRIYGNGSYVVGLTRIKAEYAPTKTKIVLDNQSATSAGTDTVTATYGATTNLTSSITVPTKTDYVFGGYYTEENGAGTQLIDKNGAWIASKTNYTDGSKNWQFANPDLTLYAKWSTLTALEAGTLYEVPDMIPEGESLSSSDQFFEGLSANTKFTLIGSASSSTTPKVNNNSSNDRTIAGITFDDGSMWFKGNATVSENIPSTFGLSFIVPSAGKLYLYFDNDDTSTNIKLAKSGTSGSKPTVSSGYSVVSVTSGTYYMYGTSTSSPYSFYGLKFVPTYDITLHDNNGGDNNGSADVAVNGTTLLDIDAPTRSGYAVTGYYAEAECTTLVADAEGNLEANVTVSAVDWTDKDGKWVKGSGATLYAKWGRVYTVAFNTNGGSSVDAITQTSEGASITMPAAPTKDGYTFQGWYIGSTSYAVSASYTPTADITAYASWKAECGVIKWDFTNRTEATLTANKTTSYTADDGVTEMRYSAGSSDKIVAYDSEKSIDGHLYENGATGSGTVYDIDETTNVGKTRLIRLFVAPGSGTLRINCNGTNGVYKVLDGSASGTTLISSLSANTTSSSITLTTSPLWIETTTKGYINDIRWTPSSTVCYYVTYNGNGADGGYVNDPEAHSSGDNVTTLANSFTRTGCTFTGWNTASDGSGTAYVAGGTIRSISGNVTLYAQWKITVSENKNLSEYTSDALSTTDVVVTNGATLTVTEDTEVRNIIVETGSTLNVNTTNGDGTGDGVTLATNSLSLVGGWGTVGGETKYDMPRVFINSASKITKTTKTINFDIAVDNRNFYPIAVPFPVTVSDVDYVNATLAYYSNYGTSGQYVIKTYDGQKRANADMSNCWRVMRDGTKHYVTSPGEASEVMVPGQGYILRALPASGYGDYAVIRFPMKNVDDEWTNGGEKGSITVKVEEKDVTTTKNAVSVVAYENNIGGDTKKSNKGWNILGVPYMSCFVSSEMDSDPSDAYLKGLLNITTGEYEKDNDNIYVTVPVHDFSEYIQTPIDEAVLKPGWCFFVQMDKNATLTFDKVGERASAPFRATTYEHMPIVKTGIILSSETASDKTTFLISDKYSAAEYEINADLEKMFGENSYTLATYSLSNETRLAYNAMSRTDATNVIPIGYRAPAEGEYTFAINPRYAENGDFERIDLIDYETGFVTNLLQSSYTFTSDRTQSDSRFALNVVPQKETPTDVEPVTGDGLPVTGARKVIIDNKLYIILNGKMYDAKGVMVK